jgi:hypothetical protein
MAIFTVSACAAAAPAANSTAAAEMDVRRDSVIWELLDVV